MGCNVFSSEILAVWDFSDRFLCGSACRQRSWLCSKACYKLAVNFSFSSLSHRHNNVLLHLCISMAQPTGLAEEHEEGSHWLLGLWALQRSFLTCRFALPVCTVGTWRVWQERTWPLSETEMLQFMAQTSLWRTFAHYRKSHGEAAPPKPTLAGPPDWNPEVWVRPPGATWDKGSNTIV